MMELFELLKKSKEICAIEKSFKNGNLSHSFLVSSDDELLSSHFIKVMCSIILNEDLKVLAGVHPDVTEFPKNGNKNMIVEDVEEILEKSVVKPSEADFKVFILHSNDVMRLPVQNKLLKILEEPPKDLFIIIESKNTNDLISTVLSRLDKVYLDRLTKDQFKALGFDDELYYQSGKNVSYALCLKNDPISKELFNKCERALLSLKSSSDILAVCRVLLDKKDIQQIILNFTIIFEDILMSKTQNTNGFFNEISRQFSLESIAEIVMALDLAKQKIKFNCNNQAVLDCLITSIVEERAKWTKRI